MAAGVAINLRGSQKLKSELQNIAQKKATSVNEVAIKALAEYAKNYTSEPSSPRKEIPTAEEAKMIREKERKTLFAEVMKTAKCSIECMLEDGDLYTAIKEDEIPKLVRDDMLKELKSLGYYLLILETHITKMENGETIYLHKAGDLIIALDKSDISDLEVWV